MKKTKIKEPEWEVGHISLDTGFYFHARKGLKSTEEGASYVHPPNVLEKLFGVTYHMKLEKAIRKQKMLCKKLNERDAARKMAEEDITEGLEKKGMT